jgi:hypothetical protein
VFPVKYVNYPLCILNKRQEDGYANNCDSNINIPSSQTYI